MRLRRQEVDLPASPCATAAPHSPTSRARATWLRPRRRGGFAVYRAITWPGSLFLPGIGRAHVIEGPKG
jgi:hypothetical protein